MEGSIGSEITGLIPRTRNHKILMHLCIDGDLDCGGE